MKINEIIHLSERLLTAVDADRFKEILKRNFPKLVFKRTFKPSSKPDVEYDLGGDSTLKIEIPDITGASEFWKIIKMIEALGWFPSYHIIYAGRRNPEDMKSFGMPVARGQFDKNEINKWFDTDNVYAAILYAETKFGAELPRKKWPKFFYHATDKAFLDKILKIGLTPRSKSKESWHPERIYVVTNKAALSKLGADLSRSEGKRTARPVILKIDAKSLPDNVKFYVDPNFWVAGTRHKGYFTHANIPPSAIKDVEDLFYN